MVASTEAMVWLMAATFKRRNAVLLEVKATALPKIPTNHLHLLMEAVLKIIAVAVARTLVRLQVELELITTVVEHLLAHQDAKKRKRKVARAKARQPAAVVRLRTMTTTAVKPSTRLARRRGNNTSPTNPVAAAIITRSLKTRKIRKMMTARKASMDNHNLGITVVAVKSPPIRLSLIQMTDMHGERSTLEVTKTVMVNTHQIHSTTTSMVLQLILTSHHHTVHHQALTLTACQVASQVDSLAIVAKMIIVMARLQDLLVDHHTHINNRKTTTSVVDMSLEEMAM